MESALNEIFFFKFFFFSILSELANCIACSSKNSKKQQHSVNDRKINFIYIEIHFQGSNHIS